MYVYLAELKAMKDSRTQSIEEAVPQVGLCMDHTEISLYHIQVLTEQVSNKMAEGETARLQDLVHSQVACHQMICPLIYLYLYL